MNYTPNFHDTGEWLKGNRGPELKAELNRRARFGLSVAQALAPVSSRPGDRHRGALRASGRILDNGLGGRHGDRIELLIEFTVEYAVNDAFRQGYPHARDFLKAAIPVVERG